MPIELKYPHIVKPIDESAHLERVPRVRVAQIVSEYLAWGWTTDQIARQHPYLTPAEIHAAFLYYYDHREEIEGELDDELTSADAFGGNPEHQAFASHCRSD